MCLTSTSFPFAKLASTFHVQAQSIVKDESIIIFNCFALPGTFFLSRYSHNGFILLSFRILWHVRGICKKTVTAVMNGHDKDFWFFKLFHDTRVGRRCKVLVGRTWTWCGVDTLSWFCVLSSITGIFGAGHDNEESKESCECCQVPD